MKPVHAISIMKLTIVAALIVAMMPATPAQAASTVQLLNPSDYSPSLTVSDKEDTDETYHLVAWVGEVPADPLVEFEVADPSGVALGTFTGTQVGTDTWEAEYPVPENQLDGQYVVRAILYQNVIGTGGTEVTRSEKVVTINSSDVPPPPTANTVEMSYPENGGNLGFFTPTGGKASTVVEGDVSDGTAQVRALYTFSEPGTDPEWVACGTGSPSGGEVKIRCTLADDGPASRVRAVALVANQTASPATPVAPADESGDAHRVTPYVQIPSSVSIDPDSEKVDVSECAALTATFKDQMAQPVAGLNVDVHADGPDDQLKFANQRGVASGFAAPDKAHATEPTAKCEPTDDAATQGDHNVAQAADKKHIESKSGTSNNGSFTFVLISEAKGGTFIEAWADVDGDDAQGATEVSGGAQLGWGTSPPEPPKQLLLDPQNSQSATGSCQRLVAAAREGGRPLDARDIDVHIKGPEGVAFCAVEGGDARPPDSGEHTGGYHADGTGHAEGLTDAQGQFAFGVTSSSEGVTDVSVWLDNDGDDEQDQTDDEPSVAGQIAWGGETRDVPTTVTLRYKRPNFKGTASSSEAQCRQARGILLKRAKKGKDATSGSATTDAQGSYKIRLPRAKGRYYAIVSKTTVVTDEGDTLVCQRAKSRTIKVRRPR
jgi:hypothetical protein